MAVVVRNQGSAPVRIPGKSNDNVILPGQTLTLTEEEFSGIHISLRGVNGIYAVTPNESDGETLKQLLEYYQPGGTDYFLRYLGYARQSALTSESVWIVRRFNHTLLGSAYKVTDIQTIEHVKWDDRATLGWL